MEQRNREIPLDIFLEHLKPNHKEESFALRYALLKNVVFEWPNESGSANSFSPTDAMTDLLNITYKWRDIEWEEESVRLDLEAIRSKHFSFTRSQFELLVVLDSAAYRLNQLKTQIYVPGLIEKILNANDSIEVTAEEIQHGYISFWNRFGYFQPPLPDKTTPRLLSKEAEAFESDARLQTLLSAMGVFMNAMRASLQIHPVICYGFLRKFEIEFNELATQARQAVESDFRLQTNQKSILTPEEERDARVVVKSMRKGQTNRELANEFELADRPDTIRNIRRKYLHKAFSPDKLPHPSKESELLKKLIVEDPILWTYLQTLEKVSATRQSERLANGV